MLNWLKQTSTIGGILGLVITGLTLAQDGAEPLAIAIGVLSAALLLVKDGKFLAGLCVVAFIGTTVSACASVPIPKDAQIAAAVSIGCAALDAGGCFEDVQEVFPGLDAESCPARVEYMAGFVDTINDAVPGVDALDLAKVIGDKWDPTKFDPVKLRTLKNADCAHLERALGVI